MTPHIIKPNWLAAAILIAASAALFACTESTSTASVPLLLAPTATSAPSPSPTPPPELLLIAEGEVAWEGELEDWAAQRGWVLTRADPSGAAAYLSESKPHIAAIVSRQEALSGDLQLAAAEGVPVVVIDVPGVSPGSKLSTISSARHDQAGFLAGVMTGLASQTGWVGQVTATGGSDEQAYSVGFAQGLLWGCPKCQLVSKTAAEMTMDGFRGQGVDIVFPFPGPAADEAANMLAEGNLPMVWVGEGGPPAESRVGRVIFEADRLIVPALDELMQTGEGTAWPYSIESRSILQVDINSGLLSPGRQRLLDEAYEAIAAGELDIGTDLDA